MVRSAQQPHTSAAVADMLTVLYEGEFGGKKSGRFRISRKFLRQLAGRRKLSDAFVAAVAEELFERGFVLIDLETHFAVLSQSLLNGYRHVTRNATAMALEAVATEAEQNDAGLERLVHDQA